MAKVNKIVDRQIGRNPELFAASIAKIEEQAARYPYLRILVGIVEQAHPELNQAPAKDRQIAHLVSILSNHLLNEDEVAEVVRVRDEERGYYYE
jgi:hypothetical protein